MKVASLRGSQLEYVCDACGRRQAAGARGLPPLGWLNVEIGGFGRAHACSEFCRMRLKKGGIVAQTPEKLTVEYYETTRGFGNVRRKKLLHRITLDGILSPDDGLKRAKERAALDGRRVISANFRADDAGRLDAIVVYVEEAAK